MSRTAIALLEQGRRVPSRIVFEEIGRQLNIPETIWEPFAKEESSQRQEFEAALGELVGRTITLKMMHLESVHAAEKSIDELFSADLTPEQAFDTLNSVLVYYGIPLMKKEFFERYFKIDAFHSVQAFENATRRYQKEAIRLFSTFAEAYRTLNGDSDLGQLLAPLRDRDISSYTHRTVWEHQDESASKDIIKKIDESRLPYLGYISAARYKQQRKKRKVLAGYLRELATEVREKGTTAVDDLGEKKRRKMDSLFSN